MTAQVGRTPASAPTLVTTPVEVPNLLAASAVVARPPPGRDQKMVRLQFFSETRPVGQSIEDEIREELTEDDEVKMLCSDSLREHCSLA
jgi:hypothetical protein